MCKKKNERFLGYHVVCIIDVLGQKDKLAKWADLDIPIIAKKMPPNLLTALRETAGTVLKFQDKFLAFFKQFHQIPIPHTHEKNMRRKLLDEVNMKVQRFSDTFVFYSPVANNDGDISVIPLYKILTACCYAMLDSLANLRSPIRGGITIGPGLEIEDHHFYGPSLAEAHYLEKEIAGYPRVVISNAVRDFLAKGQTYSKTQEIDRGMQNIAKKSRDMLCQDIDGYCIVDFLGKGLRSLFSQDDVAMLAEMVRPAYNFVQSEANRFRKDGNSKLAVRYHLLKQYIESRLPIWGIKDSPS